MSSRTFPSPREMAAPLAALALAAAFGAVAARALPLDPEEQANCERVSQITNDNAAPVMEALERLARERYGRSFAELTADQVVALSRLVNVEGRQMTATQQRIQDRCEAAQQRMIAKESTAGGFRSLFGAQSYLDRWGQERLAGLGCSCPGFQVAGEEVDHSCPTIPSCPGQRGGPRIPDRERGCRSIGAAAWIRGQLPEFYRVLDYPLDSEEVRDVRASLARPVLFSGCAPLPQPLAPMPPSATGRPAGSAFTAAIGPATACFASPAVATCQEALVRGDQLVAAAQRAGREKCLGYALTARTLWGLGADPRFTDLLVSYPEASRLRNEARIALRYLRMDCRGL